MFQLYDKYFFKEQLSKWSTEQQCSWNICWDVCKKGIAGTCGRNKKKDCNEITIKLNPNLFYDAIKKLIESGDKVIRMDDENECDNILSCMMLTFEHEMIHGLQQCFCYIFRMQ